MSSMDSTVKVECGFFSLFTEDVSGSLLAKKVEEMLPTKDKKEDLSAVITKLRAIKQSTLFKHVGELTQSVVNVRLTLLGEFAIGVPPTCENPSPLLLKAPNLSG